MNREKISREFNLAISKGIFPGAVLLCALNHRIIFHEAYGLADIFEPGKMQKDSIFDLASLTKPLATTLAIAKLIEKKTLSCDWKISHILKEFQHTDKSDITIDMLLRHTSGLPAHRNYYLNILCSDEDPIQCQRKLLLREKLENKPGEKQVYSDLGFMILAWIFEQADGRRLDRFVTEEIYLPLGVDRLFFMDLHSKNEKYEIYRSKFVATQHCPWRKKVLKGEVDDENAFAVGGIDGHAGLFGDSASVYRVCREILTVLEDKPSAVLAPEVIKKFVIKDHGFGRVAGFDIPSTKNSSSGCFFSGSAIGHLGFTGTSFWMDPEKGLIVILLTNRGHPERLNNGIKEFRPAIHDLIQLELTENSMG